MAQIISNEIPSGLVNGVNKVFTTTVDIHQIMTLTVDGAEYFDFTIGYNTNTITLTDAPTLSIYVDYIGTGFTSPSTSLVDLQDLRDIFYGILREEGPSSAYPLILCDLFLNSSQQKILAGRVVHPFTKQEATAGDLNFINEDVYYSNVQGTYTTINATLGDIVLNVSNTTDFPTTGTLFIGGQIVSYTGLTATSFTGVTPLKFPFIAGTMVSIAFELPSDFSDIKNVVYNNKIKLPPKQYDDMFEDLNNYKGSNFQRNKTTSIYESPYKVKPFYTIKDAKYLIVYQLNETGESIHVRYEKQAPMMTTTQGPTIDNLIYAQNTIPYLAVAEMLFNRGEEARAGQLYDVAITNVTEMYSWYNDSCFESQNGVNYITAKGKLNI